MDSLWDLSNDGLEEVTNEPVNIINIQAGLLAKITDSKVHATIENIHHNFRSRSTTFEEKLDDCNFRYSFIIKSQYMTGYSSNVFSIYYNIPFYPVCLIVCEGLQNELLEEQNDLKKTDGIFYYYIKDEQDLIKKLELIFRTKYIRTILHTIIKIADNEIIQSKENDLPF